MTPSKWWVEAERWRELDAARDALPFTPRDYDEMLDEAAQIYARWRQGSEAETDPSMQGPFQQSYVNALMFMPDVIDMVCAREVGDTSGRRDDGMGVLRDLVEAFEPLTDHPRNP